MPKVDDVPPLLGRLRDVFQCLLAFLLVCAAAERLLSRLQQLLVFEESRGELAELFQFGRNGLVDVVLAAGGVELLGELFLVEVGRGVAEGVAVVAAGQQFLDGSVPGPVHKGTLSAIQPELILPLPALVAFLLCITPQLPVNSKSSCSSSACTTLTYSSIWSILN